MRRATKAIGVYNEAHALMRGNDSTSVTIIGQTSTVQLAELPSNYRPKPASFGSNSGNLAV